MTKTSHEQDKKTSNQESFNHAEYLHDSKRFIEFVNSLPLPAWIKLSNGRMYFVNKEYTKQFGITLEEYYDQEDTAAWSGVEARSFKKTFKAVLKKKTAVKSVEIIANRVTKKTERLEVINWPLTIESKVVGIAGLVLNRLNIPENFLLLLFSVIPLKIVSLLTRIMAQK